MIFNQDSIHQALDLSTLWAYQDGIPTALQATNPIEKGTTTGTTITLRGGVGSPISLPMRPLPVLIDVLVPGVGIVEHQQDNSSGGGT